MVWEVNTGEGVRTEILVTRCFSNQRHGLREYTRELTVFVALSVMRSVAWVVLRGLLPALAAVTLGLLAAAAEHLVEEASELSIGDGQNAQESY